MNTYTTVGRLTNKPEVRSTQSGKKIASFTLAINTGYGDKKSTLFLDCKAWEGLAGVLDQYTDKGSQIAISGNLEQESWEKDGQKRTKVVCVVKSLELLGSKKESAQSMTSQSGNDLPDINIDEAMNEMTAQMPF